ALLRNAQTYRLTDDPDRALWVERDTGLPLRLGARVDGGATPAVITVDFGDFVAFGGKGTEKEQLRVPRRYTYSLNGKVFKQVQVTDFQLDPTGRNVPLQRLRQQAAQGQTASQGKP